VPLTPGSIVDLEIEKAAAGGRMLGRHEGQVVLVWGAVPGERVQARIERVGKGVIYAETTSVLRASPHRRPSPADWRCGGNALAHIDYARQLQVKGEIVQDAFRRIARSPLSAPPAVVASPESGYRMRARLHAHGARLGFYREGSHQLCDAAVSAQLLPSTLAWIADAEAIMQRDRLVGLGAVDVAESVDGEQRACHLELDADADAAPFAALADTLVGLSAQRAGDAHVDLLAGEPLITDVVTVVERQPEATVTLRRDVRAFFQGNRFLLERLVRHVVGLVPAGPVVDLYAGVGLFGLSVAAAGAEHVTLIEGDPISGADLETNAARFARVRVKRRSVETYLGAIPAARGSATFIIDPPRTGMSREALSGIVRVRPITIVYVSCDVATLARDTRVLLDAGYTLGPLTAFDLFPNTAHVETVVRFEAEGPTAAGVSA
jgi:23S rRNA (uracil1939-C5)-methyltransferase